LNDQHHCVVVHTHKAMRSNLSPENRYPDIPSSYPQNFQATKCKDNTVTLLFTLSQFIIYNHSHNVTYAAHKLC